MKSSKSSRVVDQRDRSSPPDRPHIRHASHMFARPTLRMIARSAAPSHLRRTVARTYVNDASQSTAPAKAVAAVLVGAAGYSLYASGDAAQKTEELSSKIDDMSETMGMLPKLNKIQAIKISNPTNIAMKNFDVSRASKYCRPSYSCLYSFSI